MNRYVQFVRMMSARARSLLLVGVAYFLGGCYYTVDSFDVTSPPESIDSLVVQGEATYSTDFDRLVLDLSLENHGDHEFTVPMSGLAFVSDTNDQESITPSFVERRWRPLDKPGLNEQNDPLDESGYDYDNLVIGSAPQAAVAQIGSVHAKEKVKLKLHFDFHRFEEGTFSYAIEDVTDGSTKTIILKLKRVRSTKYPFC